MRFWYATALNSSILQLSSTSFSNSYMVYNSNKYMYMRTMLWVAVRTRRSCCSLLATVGGHPSHLEAVERKKGWLVEALIVTESWRLGNPLYIIKQLTQRHALGLPFNRSVHCKALVRWSLARLSIWQCERLFSPQVIITLLCFRFSIPKTPPRALLALFTNHWPRTWLKTQEWPHYILPHRKLPPTRLPKISI